MLAASRRVLMICSAWLSLTSQSSGMTSRPRAAPRSAPA